MDAVRNIIYTDNKSFLERIANDLYKGDEDLLIVTILFIIYSEYSVGGLLIRSNSSGGKSMNFSSMLNFMINPLHKTFLWNFRSLDINYPFVILTTIIIYKLSTL